jgi:hypothetical protein
MCSLELPPAPAGRRSAVPQRPDRGVSPGYSVGPTIQISPEVDGPSPIPGRTHVYTFGLRQRVAERIKAHLWHRSRWQNEQFFRM